MVGKKETVLGMMGYAFYWGATYQKYFWQKPPSGDNLGEYALWFATNLPWIGPAAIVAERQFLIILKN